MRVTRTFGFIDLCGFTAFTDTYGDSEAVDVLAEFRGSVRRVASDRGVRIGKWLGDGAMFVGIDEAELVATTLEVGRSWGGWPMALRAGIASGDVILFEGDDHIGSAVNLASRLCDIAGEGELLVPSSIAVPAELLMSSSVAVPGLARMVDVDRYLFGDESGLRLVAPA